MQSSSSRVFSVEQEGIQQEARVDHPLLMPSTVEGRPGTNVATATGGGGQATEMRARLTKSLSLKRQKYDNVDEKGNGKILKNHYLKLWCYTKLYLLAIEENSRNHGFNLKL